MKKLIKFLKDILTLDDEPKKTHWTDDWDKAEYKIKKYTNANGYCSYIAFRILNDNTYQVNKYPCTTYEEVKLEIENNKEFYRKEWNIINTGKEEWIDYK